MDAGKGKGDGCCEAAKGWGRMLGRGKGTDAVKQGGVGDGCWKAGWVRGTGVENQKISGGILLLVTCRGPGWT